MTTLNRMLSRPVRIHWAGWESDTYSLQRAGWSFSAEQDIYNRTMRLSMHHAKMKLSGITEVVEWEYRSYPDYFGTKPREMHMVAVGNVHIIDGKIFDTLNQTLLRPKMVRFDPCVFHPIDCTPTVTTEEVKRLEDYVYFAPLDYKSIILPDEAVPELMARILELQEPARQEQLRNQVLRPTHHASIMSIAS